MPLYATRDNRGTDGDIGFLKENYETQLKIDIYFFPLHPLGDFIVIARVCGYKLQGHGPFCNYIINN